MASKMKTTKRPFLEVGSDVKPSLMDDFSPLSDCSISELIKPRSLPTSKQITPKPGFCVKARTEEGAKIFINVCHHPDMPFPPELQKKTPFFDGDKSPMDSFPLSLGEPHTEADKSGELCQCYDVVVNTDCFKRTADMFYQDIIMSISVTGIERKYGITIDIGTCKVLNKKYHGTMPPHFIRVKPVLEFPDSVQQPVTDENDKLSMSLSSTSIRESPRDLDMKVASTRKIKNPEIRNPLPVESMSATYKLFQVPASGSPSLLIFQALMPSARSSNNITVHVSESNLVVREELSKEVIDIVLPFKVDKSRSLANFFEGKFVVAMPIATPD